MSDISKPALSAGRWFDRLLVPIIIVLVGLASFGLGRLSALGEQESELRIHEPQEHI